MKCAKPHCKKEYTETHSGIPCCNEHAEWAIKEACEANLRKWEKGERIACIVCGTKKYEHDEGIKTVAGWVCTQLCLEKIRGGKVGRKEEGAKVAAVPGVQETLELPDEHTERNDSVGNDGKERGSRVQPNP